MRIYVASLSDYNEGRLHGTWIDLEDHAYIVEEVEQEIQKMLAESKSPFPAEEYAIHDYEDFDGYKVNEHSSITELCEYGEAVSEWGEEMAEAFGAWLAGGEGDGLGMWEAARQFEDRFYGIYDDAAELGMGWGDSYSEAQSVGLADYVDWERYGDAILQGMGHAELGDGRIAVWSYG